MIVINYCLEVRLRDVGDAVPIVIKIYTVVVEVGNSPQVMLFFKRYLYLAVVYRVYYCGNGA